MKQSVNGLSPRDEKLLQDRLAQIEAVLAKHFLLGGREVTGLKQTAERIRTRLDPPTVAALDTRASEVLRPLMDFPWAKEAVALTEALPAGKGTI